MKQELTVLDLFSGIGGFSLGLEAAGFRTVAFCEIEPFCRKVLQKHWPEVPIATDINQLSYENGALYDAGRVIYEGKIDLICGGFPCQPFSVAGRKKGTKDDRDLWPQMFRLIQQIQPTWIIGENVANFVNLAFSRTKINLESEGYTVQPIIIPACAVGAPHRRDRVWIVAHTDGERCDRRQQCSDSELREQQICQDEQENRDEIRCKTTTSDELCSPATNCDGQRTQGNEPKSLCGQQAFSWFKNVRRVTDYFDRPNIPGPLICRNSDGFSSRVDRLRALGNAVVPQIPEAIEQAIIKSIIRK